MSVSSTRVSGLLSLAAALAFSVPQQSVAAVPNPPAKICVGSSCANAPQPGSGIKWHPGHYMSMRGHRAPDAEMGYINAISNETSLAGILVEFRWESLEPTKGVYDFSLIDRYIAQLKTLKTPKKLVIRLEERAFGTIHPGAHAPVPPYLYTDPTYMGGDTPMGYGLVAKIWDAPVMDRLIALYQALGAKYDSEPYVEGISGSETAVSFNSAHPAPGDFSNDKLLAQWQRLAIAARAAWPHSMVNVETNFLGSDDQMESLIKTLVQYQGTAGGPDLGIDGHGASQAEHVLNGTRGSSTDYRLSLPIKGECQATDFKTGVPDSTPQAIFATAYNTNHASYMWWDRTSGRQDRRQNWSTGILPFIQSIKGMTWTDCPGNLAQAKCNIN